MEANSGHDRRRNATPLGVFGTVLTVFVMIEALAWLWSHTMGAGIGWFLVSFFGGVALVILWLIYLAVWTRRQRRFAWHLLIIPTVGLLGLAAGITGLPHKARWAYDEPRFTAAAQEALSDTRTEFHDSVDRRIGSQTVYGIDRNDGAVTFSYFSGSFSVTTLEYRPDGSTPEFGGEVRGEHLSGPWWSVMID